MTRISTVKLNTAAAIMAIALAGGHAMADDFFVPNGMDAATQSKVQRVISDHLSRDKVDDLSPETVTIGSGGGTVCQQGVINQSGDGSSQSAGDIILVDPINVCIDE